MWLFNFGGGTASARVSFCDMIFNPNSVSRKPITVASNLSGLYVLQEFASLLILCLNGLVPVESVFFSSLGSITTLVDCILRKIRGFLMVISIDSVKVELLEDNTQKRSPSSSSNQRLGSTSCKHKGNTRNMKKPMLEAKSDKNINLSTKSGKVHSFYLSTDYMFHKYLCGNLNLIFEVISRKFKLNWNLTKTEMR